MLDQFRSALVSANLTTIFLGLLTESYATEGEIREQLHRRFGATPSAKEFRSLVRALSSQGYIEVHPGRGRSLRISRAGLLLLDALRAENRRLTDVLVD
jgi:hypothetical protein